MGWIEGIRGNIRKWDEGIIKNKLEWGEDGW